MMNKKLLYHIIEPYKCPICKEDLLFFTTKFNDKIIDYKRLLDNGNTLDETKHYLEKRNIRHFRCIHCDREFIIDWTEGWPIPITNKDKLKIFGV